MKLTTIVAILQAQIEKILPEEQIFSAWVGFKKNGIYTNPIVRIEFTDCDTNEPRCVSYVFDHDYDTSQILSTHSELAMRSFKNFIELERKSRKEEQEQDANKNRESTCES